MKRRIWKLVTSGHGVHNLFLTGVKLGQASATHNFFYVFMFWMQLWAEKSSFGRKPETKGCLNSEAYFHVLYYQDKETLSQSS